MLVYAAPDPEGPTLIVAARATALNSTQTTTARSILNIGSPWKPNKADASAYQRHINTGIPFTN